MTPKMRLKLIPIMFWFERAFGGDADVIGLIFVQLGQFQTDAVQMQARHLFIQMLGQDIHARRIVVTLGPQFNLGQNLVRKGRRHHE